MATAHFDLALLGSTAAREIDMKGLRTQFSVHLPGLLIALGIVLGVCGTASGQILWGLDTDDDQLFTFDTETGTVANIGTLPAFTSGDLAFDSAGNLYAMLRTLAASRLYSVNPMDASAMQIGSVIPERLEGFEIVGDTAYATQNLDQDTYIVNLADGTIELLGSHAQGGPDGITGLATDSQQLYGMRFFKEDTVVVDLATGGVDHVIGFHGLDQSIAIGYADGKLWAMPEQSFNVYSIDLQNGNPTLEFSGLMELSRVTGLTRPVPTSGGLIQLDIKPGACPNSFNRNSHGVLPVALVGTDSFNPMNVDLATVLLTRADGVGGSVASHEGPPGPHSEFEDVATPFDGQPCDCHELGGDGVTDLSMKFKTDDVVAALQLNDLPAGDLVELVVSGALLDGTPFSASDCIRLVPPGTSGGLLAVGSNLPGAWLDVSPLDLQLDGGGFGNFERTYPLTTVVTLTAPAAYHGWVFSGWLTGGSLYPGQSIDITISGFTFGGEPQSATALYAPAGPTTGRTVP